MMSLLRRLVLSGAAALLTAAAFVASASAQNTFVRIQTTQGLLDVKLLDTEAPATVANFLAYVRAGDYTDVFVHRDAWNGTTPFVIQAGGFKWTAGTSCCSAAAGSANLVPTRPPVVNEFSPTRSNVRGTVAMAKLGGDPNSATNQWFVNMSNNAANLDNQNGGFTVFARVTAPGMVVADRIAGLPRYNYDGATFSALPLQNWAAGQNVFRTNFVLFQAAAEIPAATTPDRVFNYLEAAYPQYVGAFATSAGEAYYFTYRYYAATNSYLGEKDGHVWFYAPNLLTYVLDLGATSDWLGVAQANGY